MPDAYSCIPGNTGGQLRYIWLSYLGYKLIVPGTRLLDYRAKSHEGPLRIRALELTAAAFDAWAAA